MAKRRRPNPIVLALGVLSTAVVLAGVGFMEFAPNKFGKWMFGPDVFPETRALPGSAKHFDPIAAYDEVQAFAGAGLELESMDVAGARADGVVDLTGPNFPGVTYAFRRGDGGRRVEIKAEKPGRLHVTMPSGEGEQSSFDYVTEGLTRTKSGPNGTHLRAATAPPLPLGDMLKAAGAPAVLGQRRRSLRRDGIHAEPSHWLRPFSPRLHEGEGGLTSERHRSHEVRLGDPAVVDPAGEPRPESEVEDVPQLEVEPELAAQSGQELGALEAVERTARLDEEVAADAAEGIPAA